MSTRTIFVIGGTGFIGAEVVRKALAQGFAVRALARSEATAARLESAGAEPVRGDARDPSWAESARGTDVLVDLFQPALPKRLSRRAMGAVARERVTATGAQLAALGRFPAGERPVYCAISGADDLEPGEGGVISHESALRSPEAGFGVVGVPVHRVVGRSGLEAAFVHFGVMVYGPEKGFADVYVAGLRKGRAAVIGAGENKLPLTHVADAARALVHLAGLPRTELAGRTFLAAESSCTQAQFLDHTAELMNVKRPRRVPAAIAGLIGGAVAAEAMTFDADVDSSALTETGFEFRFPSCRDGVAEVLAALGELPTAGQSSRQAQVRRS